MSYPQGNPTPGGSPVQNLTTAGWGLLGAAGLTVIASFLPWYKAEVEFGDFSASESITGWNRFWWLPILLALAIGVVYALQTFNVIKPQPQLPLVYFWGGVATFVLTLFALIDTFTHGESGPGYSAGPSFGVFIAVITTAALAYFGALVAQEAGSRLPFKVPGPGVR